MSCVKLAEIVNSYRVWNLEENVHELSLSSTGNVVKINVSKFDVVWCSFGKIGLEHKNYAAVLVVEVLESYVLKVHRF